MEYRINKTALLETLKVWNGFLKRKVRLIACGGTALTLLGIKASTKDVDFMVPDSKEYRYLTDTLRDLGYRQATGSGWSKKGDVFVYDLFEGKRIHTTELLRSPLEEGRHIPLEKFSYLSVGILNFYDLVASKLTRGAGVDFEDCLMLVKTRAREIDISLLKNHFLELAGFDVAEERIRGHWHSFERILKKENLIHG